MRRDNEGNCPSTHGKYIAGALLQREVSWNLHFCVEYKIIEAKFKLFEYVLSTVSTIILFNDNVHLLYGGK